MYLLDTNVVSEMRKIADGKADPRVTAWQAHVDLTHCHLSAITLMELDIGILRLERRDIRQGTMLRHWLDQQVLRWFHSRILPVDTAVAHNCARLHIPDPRPERDALIAATALAHGMTVVTRNTVDFAGMGVPLINPWDTWTLQEARQGYAATQPSQ